MPNQEIQLNPVDFITIGTVGPKGRRVFYLQAGQGEQIATLQVEKEQAWALCEAIEELLADLVKRYPDLEEETAEKETIDEEAFILREPIQPLFRVAQMGLGYDEEHNLIVLVIEELLSSDEAEEGDSPSVVRLWIAGSLMRQLGKYGSEVVRAGRPDPSQNGHIRYYWGMAW
ncbi:MAG: DUF3090 family protein [Chloroflexi bacterium]|nr:DUF3090 family protein [Chloroflexota bacterium]